MGEGIIIIMMLVLMLLAAAGIIVYSMRLAQKYRRVEQDRQCVYEGELHKVDEIIYNRDDWFLRKVRFHTSNYPYVVEVLISEVQIMTPSYRPVEAGSFKVGKNPI